MQSPLKFILATAAVLIVGALVWLFTVGNVAWHVRGHFPGARVYADPASSPAPPFAAYIRLVVPSYFSRSEDIGVEVSDHPTPIDFSRFAGFRLHGISLTRCKVADFRQFEALGLPFVILTDCDISQIPPEQLNFLFIRGPKAPQAERRLIYFRRPERTLERMSRYSSP